MENFLGLDSQGKQAYLSLLGQWALHALGHDVPEESVC